MKKFFFLILLIVILQINCQLIKPKSEPNEGEKASSSKKIRDASGDENLSESSTEEEQPLAGAEEDLYPETNNQKSSNITAEDGRKFQNSSPSQESIQNELIPVIKPIDETKKEDLQEKINIKKEVDGISSGITQIFREFGYSGEIDVPENFKKRVAFYIHYFSRNKSGSQFYLRGISRGSQYLPMIKEHFKKTKLPLSLAYLPLIESGFNPIARSRVGAVGIWQFMKGTAKMYGLKISRFTDERKDPIKSTHAAAEYLNDLLAMFGSEDPFLGICAFNAGEGKILRALKKISYTERSFWTLVKKDLLKNETNEYIPQLLAVIIMSNQPDQYAAISQDTMFNSKDLKTNDEKDQEIISSLHHSNSKDNLGENALLKNDSIDKNNQGEKNKQIADTLPSKPSINKPAQKNTQFYSVEKGDTLYRIAKRFNINVQTLKKMNHLNSNHIYPGQSLKIIPSNPSRKNTFSKPYKIRYTVNFRDSLARIALLFKGVSARDILKWNSMKRTRIYPKQKLTIYLKDSPQQVLTHIVKRGENAYKISKKYNIRLEYILALNGLVSNSKLQPGQKLKIYYF